MCEFMCIVVAGRVDRFDFVFANFFCFCEFCAIVMVCVCLLDGAASVDSTERHSSFGKFQYN